jgi:hypothetical protein
MKALVELREALRTDLSWVREHTRLLERAREWDGAGRLPNRMLSGVDITTAKDWLQHRPQNAPEPTELHREFILASERWEAQQQGIEQTRLAEIAAAQAEKAIALAEREATLKTLSRRTALGMATAGGLTIVAGGLAYWGVNAEARFRQEQELRRQAAKEAIRVAAARTDIKGQVVAYAGSPGSIVYDGPGNHSPFTASILRRLADPDTSVQAALSGTNAEVLDATDQRQRPF